MGSSAAGFCRCRRLIVAGTLGVGRHALGIVVDPIWGVVGAVDGSDNLRDMVDEDGEDGEEEDDAAPAGCRVL